MGSWSETCVLSGVEIREGDKVYFAIMKPSKYHAEKMVADYETPPLLGTYNDYCGIELLENYEPLNLKIGDSYDGRIDNEIPLRIFVLASIYDYIEKMEPTDTYIYGAPKDLKTVSDCVDYQMTIIEKGLPYLDVPMFELKDDGSIDMDASKIKDRFDRFFQPSESIPHWYCRDLLHKYGEKLLPFFRRYLLLQWGAAELRRQLTPWYIMYAHQYGSPDPMLGFYEHVTGLLKAKKTEEDEE